MVPWFRICEGLQGSCVLWNRPLMSPNLWLSTATTTALTLIRDDKQQGGGGRRSLSSVDMYRKESAEILRVPLMVRT